MGAGHWNRRQFLFLSWAGLVATSLVGCSVGTSSTASAPKVQRAPGEVIFGPRPGLAIPTVVKEAGPLAQVLSAASGLKVNVLVPADASSALLWLQQGKIDVAWLEPLFYVKAKTSLGVNLLLRTLEAGKPSTIGQIVTRSDAGIKVLSDLKGKAIAATDPGDAAGWIYPAAELKKAGVDPFNDVEVKFSASGPDAVVTLLTKSTQGKYAADGAFVGDQARGDPTVSTKLKTTAAKVMAETVVLQTVQGAPTSVLLTRQGLDGKTVDALQKAFLGLNDRKDLLKPFGVDGFVTGKDADFNDLRDRAKMIGIPLTMS